MWLCASLRTSVAKPGMNSVGAVPDPLKPACCHSAAAARSTLMSATPARIARLRRAGGAAAAPAQECEQECEARDQQWHQHDVDDRQHAAQEVDVLAQVALHVAQRRAGVDPLLLAAVAIGLRP